MTVKSSHLTRRIAPHTISTSYTSPYVAAIRNGGSCLSAFGFRRTAILALSRQTISVFVVSAIDDG